MPAPRILMILTANRRPGSLDERTGLWLDTFAAPYYAFVDDDIDLTIASADGEPPVLDPKSLTEEAMTAATRRFGDDPEAHTALAGAVPLADVEPKDFDAVFVCGGVGGDDRHHAEQLTAMLRAFHTAEKPIAALGNAAAALVAVEGADGRPLLAGKRIAAPSAAEEKAVANGHGLPPDLAARLRQVGAQIVDGLDFRAHAVVDGRLVTGQNAQSSVHTAEALLTVLDDL